MALPRLRTTRTTKIASTSPPTARGPISRLPDPEVDGGLGLYLGLGLRLRTAAMRHETIQTVASTVKLPFTS